MTSNHLQKDLLASIVVFLVALPLCMGIAIASGLPPAAGLITGIVGGLVTGSLTGCKLQVSGPAAGLAVLVFDVVREHGVNKLALVIVIAGILQIAAGLLGAGLIFRSISPAVIYGMLSGIGVLILGAQFHVMLDGKPKATGLHNLVAIPGEFFNSVFPAEGASSHIALAIGILTIAILLLWPKLVPRKLRWIPGSLVAVIIATATTAAFSFPIRHVDLKGSILDAIHPLTLGSFAGAWDMTTITLALSFAFVASAETLLSAAAVDQLHSGEKTNYNRELVAQGVGNTICGFLGSLPMTGVIVRSATNVAAGAQTRLSAVMHGLWLLIMVSAVPGLLRLVPTACLAAILVYTGYKLINVENARRLLRYGGAPVVIYAATLVTIVAVDLLTGIVVGLALSVLKVVYARTHLSIRSETNELLRRVDVYLEGAATFLRLPKLADALEKIPADLESHIHFRHLEYVDDACLEALLSWEQRRVAEGGTVVLEWSEALRLYREKNPLGSLQRSDIPLTSAAH
jgi:MFS superfamily sulfate permease-like transporter